MGQGKDRDRFLAVLRSASHAPLRDEKRAAGDIERIVSGAADPARAGEDRKRKLDWYIYNLGLAYAYQTGAMPAFTNGESETRFERFVLAVPAPAELRLTRHLVKAAIRRMDAKRNPRFASDLENLIGQHAAQ